MEFGIKTFRLQSSYISVDRRMLVVFIIIICHKTFVIEGEYRAQTMIPYHLSRFDGYSNYVHSYDEISSVSLTQCMLHCSVRHKTSCSSVFYHPSDRVCKIGGEISMTSGSAIDTGWKFYGKLYVL